MVKKYYPRNLIGEIKPFLDRREYVAIVGPRQAGKTTLLNILRLYLRDEFNIKENLIKFITFEDRKLLAEFESAPIPFINSYLPEKRNFRKFYLMFDEYQYVEEGGQKLKFIYDTIDNLKIVITGSSSMDIKGNVGKFMVGRMVNFNLYPFNLGEVLNVRNERLGKIYKENNSLIIKWLSEEKTPGAKRGTDVFATEMQPEFEEYCIWGGYPEVVISENTNVRKKLLSEIYNSYILKDIKTLLELTTEKNLYLLSQYLATQLGNITVYKNLSQESDLRYKELKKHLNILNETYICKEVKPFFRNPQKELKKNPKIYFLDLGFRNSLLNNFNGLNKRTDSGAIVENTVFIRLNQINGSIDALNFWRTKSGTEVDFVLHVNNEILPLEVKYSQFKEEKIPKGLISFINSFKPKRALVLTRNFWGITEYKDTKVLFAPVFYL
jgi:predicted AAA+ superfamily ATPase